MVRKTSGEIPFTENYGFLEFFGRDYNSGSATIKSPEDLQKVFSKIYGIEFKEQKSSKRLIPSKEIIFSCQIGINSCMGYIAF